MNIDILTLKILTPYLIKSIDKYLDSFNFGEVVIKKHNERIVVDVSNRNREIDIKLTK